MSKKIICLLSVIVLLVPLFCGCKNTYSPIDEGRTFIKPEKFVFKTDFQRYPSDVKKITYTQTNISDEEVFVGDEVFLLMLKDGEWQHVKGKKEYESLLISVVIPPGDSASGSLNIEEYFYLPLEAGTYRIHDLCFYSEPFEIVE